MECPVVNNLVLTKLWRLIPITRVIVIIFGWVLIKWLWEIRIWNGKLRINIILELKENFSIAV